MFKNLKKQEGFTLIETMVALVLLTLALVPALYVSNFVTSATSTVKDDTVAANLAAEGIEVVRAIRDTNWFWSRPFDSGLTNGSWRVEYNSDSLLALAGNPPLKIDNSNYNYTSGTNTPFQRTVNITKISAVELLVTSVISWAGRSGNQKIVQTEDHLFDWK